ncbi:HNH endonuclease signature motif containing protein [Streptomyces sp. MH60]|uniref:HNH endonuclease signature motif containing protein n=1 Tax=Streptomyces sp. MH60 TaxID=1940758 RepID=UPI00406CF695
MDSSGGADACWPWTLSVVKTTGYGQFNNRAAGRNSCHVFAFKLAYGPVPDGHVVDHTCHNRDTTCPGGKTCLHRRCCNPAHLEAVDSHRENARRANEPRKRAEFAECCANGHPWKPDNEKWVTSTSGYRTRQCRACNRDRMYKKRTGRDRPAPTDVSLSRAGCETCRRGHKYTPENTKYDSTTGKRRCRACERINDQNAKARARARKAAAK